MRFLSHFNSRNCLRVSSLLLGAFLFTPSVSSALTFEDLATHAATAKNFFTQSTGAFLDERTSSIARTSAVIDSARGNVSKQLAFVGDGVKISAGEFSRKATATITRVNTTASTLRTQLFTAPGEALLAAGDTLARAGDRTQETAGTFARAAQSVGATLVTVPVNALLSVNDTLVYANDRISQNLTTSFGQSVAVARGAITTPGSALLTAGDTLARANDALTARVTNTLTAIDAYASNARETLTRDTSAALTTLTDTFTQAPASSQRAFSLDALKTTLVCFFTTCTTQVPAPAPTPALTTSTTTPKAPTRTVTTSQPKPTTPASTSNLPPTTSNLSAPPLTISTPQPEIVTKVIQTTVLGTTDETLDAKLATLRAELLAELSRVRQTTANNYQAISISNRIDHLTDTTLVNPTIRNAVITGSSLGATTGSFSGSLTAGTTTLGSTLYVDPANTRVGIGTSSPSDTLALNGALYLAQISAPAVTTNRLYNQSGSLYWNGTALGSGGGLSSFATTTSQVSGRLIVYPNNATDILTLGSSSTTTAPFFFDPNTTTGYISGNLGIGTTSPYAKLSVVGNVVADYFTATSTTATSTFGGRVVITGTGLEDYSGNGELLVLNVDNAINLAGPGNAFGHFRLRSETEGVRAVLDAGTRVGCTTGPACLATLSFAQSGSLRWGIRKGGGTESGSNVGSNFQIQSFDDDGNHYGYPFMIERSTGNVLVGLPSATALPYARLDVRSAGSGTNQLVEFSNSASTTVMRILDNGTGYFYGNLGIGTTSPYAKLSVAGTIVADAIVATSTTATSTFANHVSIASGAEYRIAGAPVLKGSGSQGIIGFGNTYSNGLSIGSSNTASGAISQAIGSSNTASALGSIAVGFSNTATSTAGVALGYGNSVGPGLLAIGFSNNAYGSGSIVVGSGITNNTANSLMIGPSDGAKLTILSSGNLGIGTTSPYAKLSVVGQTVADYFTATSTTATSTFANHISIASGKEYRINGVPVISNVTGGGSATTIGFANTLASNGIAVGSTNIATAALSTAIGYSNIANNTLGTSIGALNSATGTAATAIGYANSAGGSTALSIGVGNYAYAGNSIAIGLNVANNTANSLQIGPSDAAKLTILSSGNVGIGTTSPYAKLSVAGQVVADYFTATSTTATSTFANNISIAGGASYRVAGVPVLGYTSGGPMYIGSGNTVSSTGLAVGTTNTSNNTQSVAIGSGNTASNLFSVAIGLSSQATSSLDVAIGYNNTAGGGSSFAAGLGTRAYASGSIAIGSSIINNTASSLMIGPSDAAKVTILSSGNFGIGTTSPYAKLSVVGETVATKFTATSTSATSTIAGGLNVGNGALVYDYSSQVTSVGNLELGSLTFDTDAGMVSWIDMPVTASSSVGTVNSFTAQLDGTALLSVYGLSDGAGTVKQTAIGIGTTTPAARLTVTTATSTENLPLFLVASSTGSTLFSILNSGYVGIGTTTTAVNNALVVQGGVCITAGTTCPTVSSGSLRIDTAGVAGGDDPGDVFDLAERYPASEVMEPGDIAMIDVDASPATVKRGTEGGTALGIVSTRAAIAINGSDLTLAPGYEATSTRPLIALSGRVPVKVSLEGGAIKKGDRITLSSTPGVGKKATASAYTVGIALGTFDESSEKDGSGVGKVLVFVNLSYARIDEEVADGSILATTGSAFWNFDDATGRLNFVTPLNLNNFDIVGVRAIRSATSQWSIDEAGKLVVGEVEAQKVTTQTLCVDDVCIEKDTLRALLQRNGLAPAPSTEEPAPVEIDTDNSELAQQQEETVAPEEQSTEPETTPEQPAEEPAPEPAVESVASDPPLPEISQAPEPEPLSEPTPITE